MTLLIATVVATVLLTVILLWLGLFPEARTAWRQRSSDSLLALGQYTRRVALKTGGRLRRQTRYFNTATRWTHRQLHRHWRLQLALVAVLLTPALVVLGVRQQVRLQGYSTTITADPEAVTLVTQLLRGEQLVAPAPLPPAIFSTPEVEQARPRLQLGRANRDWKLLKADFRQRLLTVFKVMRDRYGYQMVLIEGYRSPQRQAQLLADAAGVTNAGPGQSYHQYGLAADCAFYRSGKLLIEDDTPWAARSYNLYGEVAQAAGLVWGGSWRSLRDLGHVELHVSGQGPRRSG